MLVSLITSEVAETRDQARRAARLGRISVDEQVPAVTVEQGEASGESVLPDYTFGRGDVESALKASATVVESTLRIGGQEHFYLEGQVSMAVPGEAGSMVVHASTQHPSEVQHLVARTLGVPDAAVVCQCRRMGGAFGGKESQAAQWACLVALAARATGRPAKMRLDRDDDMMMTGKRHDMRADYRYGYDARGVIEAVDVCFPSRCGCSADLSLGVNDRTRVQGLAVHPHYGLLVKRRRLGAEKELVDPIAGVLLKVG